MGIKNYLVPNHILFAQKFLLSFRVAPSWKVNINKKNNLFKDIRKKYYFPTFSSYRLCFDLFRGSNFKNFLNPVKVVTHHRKNSINLKIIFKEYISGQQGEHARFGAIFKKFKILFIN